MHGDDAVKPPNASDLTPVRHRRPRNRKLMIVSAAADLFAARGFHNVSMSDIAQAVKVQPSALYRHFASKQDLLRATIAQGVAHRVEAVGDVNSTAPLDATIRGLVQSALATRSLSSLWTTEVRLLEVDDSAQLRSQIRALPETLAARLLRARPELAPNHAMLLTWAFLDTLASISFYDAGGTNRETARVLEAIGKRILSMSLHDAQNAAPPPPPTTDAFAPRRERILQAAGSLFRHRGFAAVTLEDLADEVGIAAASVYSYFGSKQQILDDLLIRGTEWERYRASRSIPNSPDPLAYIESALRSYAEFVHQTPDLSWVRLTEIRHASEAIAGRTTTAEKDELARWSAALEAIAPQADTAQTRLELSAARMVCLDLLSTRYLERFGVSVAIACQLALAVLAVDTTGRDIEAEPNE